MAKKGDILTDFITAGFYNDVVKKLRLQLGSRGKGQVDQNQFVTVYNHEAVFKKPWEAVSLGDPRVPYNVAIDDRHSEIGFYTKALSSADPHNIAILQEPLPPEIGASAQALVVGSSWLRMPYEGWSEDNPDSVHGVSGQAGFVWVGSGNTLEYSSSGRIEVLRDFVLSPGSTALCFVVIGKLSSGSALTIYPPLVQITFTSNSHDWSSGDAARGFTADQVSPITYTGATAIGEYPEGLTLPTITIENTDNFNWLIGDKAIVRKVDSDTYRVIKVIRVNCTRFRFKLTANAPNGLTPNLTGIAIAPANGESGSPPSGSLTIKDIYGVGHNARTDHKGVAEYDYNNGWYYATECEHRSLRFRGTLAATLSGASLTMSVTPTHGLATGVLPPNPTTVYNRHGWESGEIGDIVRAEWNPDLGQYEAYQLDCGS